MLQLTARFCAGSHNLILRLASGVRRNEILLCDGEGCDVAVHQACYAVARVPRGKWYCDACKDKLDLSQPNCVCCPVVGGALRKVVFTVLLVESQAVSMPITCSTFARQPPPPPVPPTLPSHQSTLAFAAQNHVLPCVYKLIALVSNNCSWLVCSEAKGMSQLTEAWL